jgi:hypothetical protein
MSTPTPQTPPDDVPDADWAEQEIDVDPVAEEGGDPGAQPVAPNRGLKEVDEADLAEQETVVYGEDDEYGG